MPGKYHVTVKGVSAALKRAKGTRAELINELDAAVEVSAMEVVNDARRDAPRKSGALKNSIDIYAESPMERHIGSDRPYAARQEYEHKQRAGFFRNAMFRVRTSLETRVEQVLRKVGR